MTLSGKIQATGDPINQYIMEHSLCFTTEQLELIEYTRTLPGNQEAFNFFSSHVEIGTFTGYTSLTIALALPSDGQVITCDIDGQYIRQDLWKKAGVDEKITLRLEPAVQTLEKLIEEHGDGSFDFIFIDADKVNYLRCYELSIRLVRSNGLIVIDNTLWHGLVLDQTDTSAVTMAIRQLNDFIKNDQRVDISFLRLGDGTTLCRKK
ncbi:unnamed protein product [Rotaria magnacalcarata]|uniref:Caffeoyl-CoA O-methyltransferase n=1 Tax=Rotaria magnacalcarata TaxID=392030 RepID=A0A819WC67_9BILA|nr:unnamed protein product [Rotaria magnacalcarata]CAF4022402.1 unnamed protein product [Rotaria magnacalcarata]CAF4046197.1 unnamed protein product [Rotaria magnacalcarata]CAF4123541.1 unnamed protein product [Rotaria magnacalcarata]